MPGRDPSDPRTPLATSRRADVRSPARNATADGGRLRQVLILGLDPGSVHTGWGIVEQQGSHLRALAHGRVSCSRRLPLAERLLHLETEIEAVLEQWRPEVAVLESLFHGVNSRSLIVLSQARGALLATLARHRLTIREYSPAEVKSAVTGNGRAPKDQVGRMVQLLLALRRPPESADAGDALAVAVCYAHRARMERLTTPDGIS